ncbi:formate dehydrogenase accessory protein FdhE [Ancylobacter sp. 6x-1]|uniref:Protein FdhE homolog n=1 Tax=Ancylobacter crimeensis TaxID=2579147 RepID=A0ABT0DBR7_9HYPH|nr:formate dehydrogenase accessory protein FdhE [Ancylobacter crimeensis]MCK0197192.1 formate dehydrogenase accessory protein FdhE [Ancylobacter crimeensis]
MSSSIQPDPTAIGEVSTPPFVVLPDPAQLFASRADRLDYAAPYSPLGPYLRFLAGLSRAQAAILPGLPELDPPADAAVERARAHGMPPLNRGTIECDDALEITLRRLFSEVAPLPKPEAAADALQAVAAADRAALGEMVGDLLGHAVAVERLAEHVYVAAALELHVSRLAARLDAERLVPVGDGLCPACGGPPVASLIVDRPHAHGSRYCVCSLCNVQWNFVRIRCVSCGETKGIGYQGIDGGPETIKAETCDHCRSYVKVFYQNKDPSLDPVADDVVSLGLDLLMKEGPYRRAAFNPYLLGY